MKPYKCPICSGSGLVPNGFYGFISPSDSSTTPICCRSCGGSGIIWSTEKTSKVEDDSILNHDGIHTSIHPDSWMNKCSKEFIDTFNDKIIDNFSNKIIDTLSDLPPIDFKDLIKRSNTKTSDINTKDDTKDINKDVNNTKDKTSNLINIKDKALDIIKPIIKSKDVLKSNVGIKSNITINDDGIAVVNVKTKGDVS